MMRSDEHNWYVHGSYAEETDPSSNVNVMDEDKSKEIIMHKKLSENQSKDVSESEFNIVHKNLSQNNSTDVPANVITELKEDEHKKTSVIGKGKIILTYSSAVEIYWINLTLRINGHSWHHQYKRDTMHHQNERDTMTS